MSLNVCEIYRSLQGETSYMGLPGAFIRLSGCNLNCTYCDTKYAKEEGSEMTLEQVVDKTLSFGFDLVTITGGEPLIQDETADLASALIERNCTVLMETNGSLDISVVPKEVVRIVDIKCPTSGEHQSMRWENIWALSEHDEVKFVIADRHDYEWARDIIGERFRVAGTKILLSVVFGELPPRNLVEWMLEDRIKARFQLQLHKVVWPGEQRGV